MPFLLDQRPGEQLAVGVDDRRPSRVRPVVLTAPELAPRDVVGDVGAAEQHARADHVDASLARDVPKVRDPVLVVVPGGRRPDVDALRVDRGPRERHHVLPADQPAHAPERRLDGIEVGPVAEAPDEPFPARRHQLPVLPHDLAVGTEQQLRVVDRAPVELVHADRQVRLRPLRGLAELLGRRGGHLDRLLAETRRERLERAVPRGSPPHPIRIRRDERLREHDQARPHAGGLLRQAHHLLHRGVTVEELRRGLDGGDGDRLHQTTVAFGSRAGSPSGSTSTAQSARFHDGTGVSQSSRGTNADAATFW